MSSFEYPQAERLPIVDRLHGREVPDPYRWLEDPEDPRTVAWSAAQEALFTQAREGWPAAPAFAARLGALMGTGDVSAPFWRGERRFLTRRPPGQEHAVLLAVEADGTERVARTGEKAGDIALPGLGTLAGMSTRPGGGHELWFGYTDFTTPVQIHHFDARTGQTVLWEKPPAEVEIPKVRTREPARRLRGGRGMAPRRDDGEQAERLRRLPRRRRLAGRQRRHHSRTARDLRRLQRRPARRRGPDSVP